MNRLEDRFVLLGIPGLEGSARAAVTAAAAAKEEGTNKELKATFNKVMSKQVHAASAKKKEKEQTFKDVLARYGTKSKGRDLMDEVVEINKRRRLY